MKSGLIAEYAETAHLFRAIRALRDRGLTRLEAYTPYPIPALDRALDAPRSPLAIVAAAGGLVGVSGGYFAQWLVDAYLYPVNTGGRPPHMPLAFVPISIEMGFLFGGLFVFFGCLVAARLIKLWDPVFEVEGFESETRAGYWLAVDASDPAFDRATIEDELRRGGPLRLDRFGGAR